VHLVPGKLRVADLLRAVEIADTFTLGDLCQAVRDCEELDLKTFSAFLRCPLAPFLVECLQPPADTTPASDLSALCLRWRCEYDRPGDTRWPLATSLWLDVYGVGDTWEEYKPGGRCYEEDKDVSGSNTYGIELTPVYELRHLPLRIDPTMRIGCRAELEKDSLEIPAPPVTLLQLIHALFWELSFFGTPEQRDAMQAELEERVRRVKAGEEKLIPWEEVRERFLADLHKD
jgi:Putative addiction module component